MGAQRFKSWRSRGFETSRVERRGLYSLRLCFPITRSKGDRCQMSDEKTEAKEKPLEKMTVKDLREMAKEIPEISGVHGMKKEELILAIKKAKGIHETPVKKTDASVREIKKKIKAFKAHRQAAIGAKDKKMAAIYKRRISRLKKKTRRAAA